MTLIADFVHVFQVSILSWMRNYIIQTKYTLPLLMVSKFSVLLFLTVMFSYSDHCIVSAEENATEKNATLSMPMADNFTSKITAYQIPIRDQIGSPILDILRRGLKEAIRAKADLVILDMYTPGGELGVTLEILEEIIENLEKFQGKIITYVNDEAISAGAYIAIASSEIAFSPKSQIGAAEAVSGGGANIDSSMKRK